MKKIALYLWQQMDLVILLSAALLFFSIYVFAEIADEVMEGEIQRYDEAVLEILRTGENKQDPIGPEGLEQIWRDVTALGSFAVLTIVAGAVSVYLLISGHKKTLILFLAVILGGVILTYISKMLFARPRPEEFMSSLTRETSGSFPSGHAMGSAVVYLTIGVLLARTTGSTRLKIYYVAVALAITMLVGFSRVYLGVHYPSDVLGGFTGGFIWALFCWIIAYWLQKRGKIEQQDV